MQEVDSNSPAPQLQSVPSVDLQQLLEVYVKRSLSLNDSTDKKPRPELRRCWSSLTERIARDCRPKNSSHIFRPPNRPAIEATSKACTELYETTTHKNASKPKQPSKKSDKKSKKPTLLKSFLGLFFQRSHKKKEEQKHEDERKAVSTSPQCSSYGPRPSKRLSRKESPRRVIFKNFGRKETKFSAVKQSNGTILSDSAVMPDIKCEEPTSTYYEKVSDELAKIVKEVKSCSTDEGQVTFTQSLESKMTTAARENEIIEEIIRILKQEGDDIDKKIKEHHTLSSFFLGLSYGFFQQLADCYVEAETLSQLPPGISTPELVRFAVSLDFTAKLAGLSSQTVGRIMGFGNQYLQNRFTEMSLSHMNTNMEQEDQQFPSLD